MTPHEFLIGQQGRRTHLVWRDAIKVVQAGVPKPGPRRALYLANWDESMTHFFDDEIRRTRPEWWADYTHLEPEDRWAAESGGTDIFNAYKAKVEPLWALARTLIIRFDQGYTEENLRDLNRLPMRHITRLSADVRANAAVFTAAMRGNHTAGLRHLDWTWGSMDKAFFQACSHLRLWTQLRSLSLQWSRMDDEGLQTLLELVDHGGLCRLRLEHQQLTDVGGAMLGDWSGLRHLTFLGVDSVGLSDEGITRLVSGRGPFALESLYLKAGGFREVTLGPKTGEALGKSDMLCGLKVLHIDASTLGDAGVLALIKNPGLASLERLVIRSSGLSDAGAFAIAEATHLNGLQSLDLDYNYGITEAGCDALQCAPHLAHLTMRLA